MQDTAFVIDLWPSPAAFAADIGVPIGHVHVMRHRKSVPPRYWLTIEKHAAARGIRGATVADLAKIVADTDFAPDTLPPPTQPEQRAQA